jgi:hypothetical protein
MEMPGAAAGWGTHRAGAEVAAKRVGPRVHASAGDAGHQAGRRTERELHEPRRHLVGVDRLEPDPARLGELELTL